ncbi:transcriptional regulator [Corynebacterium accolens]|uniref:Transcriptional regulator n=1 Tax=Corynebacterium accolens TaxID=38284 RepID=A0ABT7FLL7_9CORY|nr:hypothetical protein [Corynebacterium accolens]EEI15370.1 hypothetical protein HMPREF0276_0516 [Corynebacterium accolens ATCC 49725]MDK4246481.1 transcriptional regulator [Corynebacterium accolens]
MEDITPNITIVRGALGKRPLTAVDITGVGKMTLNVNNILALPVNLEAEGKVGP